MKRTITLAYQPPQSAIFRFDADAHEYMDPATGEIFPHITGMLEAAGEIDARWYTEESSERGRAVHRLTAEYDLNALDLATAQTDDPRHRGYLLAHAKAMAILRPEFLSVEEPLVHPRWRFGGRPDRVIVLDRMLGVLEIKSGGIERSHQIQTALQAILVATDLRLPAHHVKRWCLYVGEKGKFKLEEHVSRRNFDRAEEILREHRR